MSSRAYRIASLPILLGAVAVASLAMGRYPLPPLEVARFLAHELTGIGDFDPERLALLRNLVLDIRWPRVAGAALIGAALATSGAAYQGVFVNPLVSPRLLGVLPGASLGAALGMLLFRTWWAVQLATFAGGFAAVVVAVLLAGTFGGKSPIMLILGGVVSSALFTSLLTAVKYAADPANQLPAIVYWLMGNMSLISRPLLAATAPAIALGVLGLIALSRQLNALSMGDDEARALGVPVTAVRLAVIAFATLVSTLTVVMAGSIDWVGLLIPHVARKWVGPDHPVLLPCSALLGAIYLLLVDDVSRLLFRTEIPIGILTALVGIPFFAVAVRGARRGWT